MESLLIPVITILLFLWGRRILVSYFIIEPINRNEKIHESWILLASKMRAAHVYYVKRTARCRMGRSPSSTRSSGGSFSSRHSVSDMKTIKDPRLELMEC